MIVPIEMKLRIQRLGWSKKMAEHLQNDDLYHRQVLAAVFRQTRLEKFQWMTEDEKLTPCATPWAKQFQDYINSLKEFEESDDFARERRWRPRRLTSFKRSSSARSRHSVTSMSSLPSSVGLVLRSRKSAAQHDRRFRLCQTLYTHRNVHQVLRLRCTSG